MKSVKSKLPGYHHQVNFADRIKAAICLIHNIGLDDLEAHKINFRKEMQDLGSLGRSYDEDRWINTWWGDVQTDLELHRRYTAGDDQPVYIWVTDLRYMNELLRVEAIEGAKTFTIFLDHPAVLKGPEADHISETGLHPSLFKHHVRRAEGSTPEDPKFNPSAGLICELIESFFEGDTCPN